MRKIVPLLICCTALGAYEFNLTPQQVTSDVHCFFGEPEVMNTTNNGNMVNTCYIDTNESYVVIDSGSSHAYARSAYNAMQKLNPLPVALVINSHVHDDHWLGNGFFAEAGVKILGSDDFVSNAVIHSPTRIQTHISPEAYAGTVPTHPDQMIGSDQTITIGDQVIELHLMKHKAHTDKDMVVFLPKSKTLFAADLVFNDRIPSVAGGNINGWIEALDELDRFGATTVVGGHGYRTDKDAAKMTRSYLTRMRSEIRGAIEAGLGIQETIQKVEMAEFKSLRMYETLHRGNVESSYRVLEWE